MKSIFTGTVGPRYKVKNGCGYYNASVPIIVMGNSLDNGGSSNNITFQSQTSCGGGSERNGDTVVIECFWTSQYRHYHNRLQDVTLSEKIKANKDNYTAQDIADLLGEDRLDYLAKHLDVIQGFPLVLELPLPLAAAAAAVGELSQTNLPNCSVVPISNWLPVGVSSQPPHNGTTWQFQSANCEYTTWTRDDLNYWLAGLRIKVFGDSHVQYENDEAFHFICPEAENTTQFYNDKYACPQQPNNTFSWGWRFYRAILPDHDLLSKDLRDVRPKSCSSMLGVGLYNVTIITTPTWLFVYEIEESLNDYVQSLRDIIQLCHQLHPSEMKDIVLLVQSPTATDVPTATDFHDHLNAWQHPADLWRGNHNFREESFTHKLYSKLGDIVDGIIPVFELTLARNWKFRTKDGVHQSGTYYSDIIHLQSSAIISAMKHSKGWKVPLMPMDDDRTHWFYGVKME